MVDKATTDEDGPTIELAPAAAEDGEDAADENDAAAEDADDATPEKAASDDDAPKPTQKIPKPRGRAPQGKAWDPDQGRWATQVDESDDDETLDVMRQRASRSASVEEDVVRPARTESLEDVESRFLGGGATPPQKEQEDEPTPEKTSDDEPQPEKNENTGRWTDDEHARAVPPRSGAVRQEVEQSRRRRAIAHDDTSPKPRPEVPEEVRGGPA